MEAEALDRKTGVVAVKAASFLNSTAATIATPVSAGLWTNRSNDSQDGANAGIASGQAFQPARTTASNWPQYPPRRPSGV